MRIKQSVHAKVRLTRAARLREVKQLVNLCFGMLEDKSFAQVADMTGLCEATVRKLHSNDFTLRTTIGSIQALAYAAGFKLELHEGKVLISLAA